MKSLYTNVGKGREIYLFLLQSISQGGDGNVPVVVFADYVYSLISLSDKYNPPSSLAVLGLCPQ